MMKKILLTLTTIVSVFTLSNAQDWILYGTTSQGGSLGFGTLFTHDLTTGKDTVVLNFDSLNGRFPQGNVALDPSNELVYGMTRFGGTNDNGVLFSYDPFAKKDSTQVMLNITYGANPILGGPIYYNNKFYGMTFDGGTSGYGVLYSFNPVNGKDSVLVDFLGGVGHEMYPYGITLSQYKGKLYGMTNYGADANNDGCIFNYNPATGKDSLVVVFDTLDGDEPGEGGLTLDPNNNLLYGMALYGGNKNSWGVIMSYNPVTGKDTAYVQFDSVHGRYPYGNLTYDSVNGMFYGMTLNGGPKDFGVLFRFNPVTGKDTVLFYFDSTHGSYPWGSLTFDTSGMLYGLTQNGGSSNDGVMFRFNPVTNKDTVLLNFKGANGSNPFGSLTLVHQLTPLSVNTPQSNMQIGVYPNPFNSTSTITFSKGGTHYIELYDVAGRKLNSIQCSGRQYELNRNGLATGVYFIRAHDEGQNFISTAKIVVE